MGWFIAWIVSVIIFNALFLSILPTSFTSTSIYTIFLFSFPVVLIVILGQICIILERKGIIKPAPPKTLPSEPEPIVSNDQEAESEEDRPFSHGRAYLENHPEAQPASSSTQIKPRQPTIEEMLHTVDLLDGPGFERWCAQLLRRIGYSDVEVTKTSGDQGVDITAVKDDVRYAIQCKCYSSDLGNHPIQEVHAGKSMYGCHVGVVMTNRYFTTGAKDLAKATGTLLWDRDKIKSMLQQIKNTENESDIE